MISVAGSRRRAEYAAETRQAIVDAGRARFAAHGFVATTVNDIAHLARVAPKTVYAVVGGKQGLLKILVDGWLDAPVINDGLADMPHLPDARAVLTRLSASVRAIMEQHGDVIRLVVTTALHDPVAAEALSRSTQDIRGRLYLVAQHLAQRGDLVDGLSTERAVDILWFYFGTTSYDALVQGAGWPADEAERWLGEQSAAALLAAPTDPLDTERRLVPPD